jgi:hypothetical protein
MVCFICLLFLAGVRSGSSESSVSLALHAALGGTPAGFHVTYLKDRHYRFLVASNHVGFAVRDLSASRLNNLMSTSTFGGVGVITGLRNGVGGKRKKMPPGSWFCLVGAKLVLDLDRTLTITLEIMLHVSGTKSQ